MGVHDKHKSSNALAKIRTMTDHTDHTFLYIAGELRSVHGAGPVLLLSLFPDSLLTLHGPHGPY